MSSPATKRARRLRRNETDAERALWNALRGQQLQGLKFRRQHPLAGFTLDLFCEELRLCVEVDGGQHAERTEEDEARTAKLATLGVEVVRYWNNDVMTNLSGVWDDLQRVVERRRASLAQRSS